MATRILRSTLTMVGAITVFSVTSCTNFGESTAVMRGNLEYGRGDYQSALVHYMVAQEASPEDSWIQFNVGNVYYALGELEAALETWQRARLAVEAAGERGSADLSLLFATSYNRGVLLFQQGRYSSAYDEFRYALTVNARSTEAKVNLELALQRLQATEASGETAQAGVSTEAGSGDTTDPDEETLRILEYVRRKETQQWFANRDAETQDQAEDW
jgi:tetratricopeptide (TPR) repeat protein